MDSYPRIAYMYCLWTVAFLFLLKLNGTKVYLSCGAQ